MGALAQFHPGIIWLAKWGHSQLNSGLHKLPVGTSVARADCDLTKNSASATVAWLSAVGWVLRLAAWVFAALFIAGFTSAVRKT
jgi:hypothetical protein